MKRHPLQVSIAKKEIEALEVAARKAASKDEYMRLRIKAHKMRKFYGLA